MRPLTNSISCAAHSRPRSRALRAAIVLLLPLALLLPGAAEAAGPSLGLKTKPKPTVKRARTEADDFLLKEIHLKAEGKSFVLSIHSPAPWSHWTLGDPARIIVDLSQTRSRLPKSPGLLEEKLDQGIVRTLRTSQNVSGPLERRVRITLELARVVPYEARRVGEDIVITIPNAGVRDGWTKDIFAPVEPEPHLEIEESGSPAPTAVDLMEGAAEGRTARPATPEVNDAVVAADPLVAESIPTEAQPEETEHSAGDEPPAAQVEPHESAQAEPDLEEVSNRGKSGDHFRSLRAALEAVVGKKNVSDSMPDTPRQPKSKPGEQASEADDAASAIKPDASSLKDSHEDALTTKEPDDSPASHDSHPDPALPDPALHDPALQPPAHEEPALAGAEEELAPLEEDAPPESTAARIQALHAQRADGLYGEALHAWLTGNGTRARKSLERARRHYAHTEGGAHASFLLREIELLSGEDLKADELQDAPDAPDPSWFPEEAYRCLLAAHEAKKNYLEVDRLYRDWGALYPDGPWRGRLDWTLGQFYLKSGRTEEGRAHLDAIPKGDEYEARALLVLAQLDEDGHEVGAALERYRYLSMLPTSRWQQRGLARAADLEFQEGSLAEALGHYEDLLNGAPPADEEAWAVYQIGNCLLLLGDANGARLRYDEVAKRFPTSFWAPFAQERMEGLAWNSQLSKAVAATARP